MPTIKRFAACKLNINPHDHMPPHFHVLSANAEWMVAIATGEILRGPKDTRAIRDALAWAAEHRALLAQRFEELQR